MINCSLISHSTNEKTVFRQKSSKDFVTVDIYENNELLNTLLLDEAMALNLKNYILSNTDSVEN